MGRYVQGQDRHQGDPDAGVPGGFISEDNPMSVIEAFVEELNLPAIGFERALP